MACQLCQTGAVGPAIQCPCGHAFLHLHCAWQWRGRIFSRPTFGLISISSSVPPSSSLTSSELRLEICGAGQGLAQSRWEPRSDLFGTDLWSGQDVVATYSTILPQGWRSRACAIAKRWRYRSAPTSWQAAKNASWPSEPCVEDRVLALSAQLKWKVWQELCNRRRRELSSRSVGSQNWVQNGSGCTLHVAV